MSLDISVIKSSFALAKPIANDVVDYFYKYMFENYPEIRPLFSKVDMPKQKQALISSLVYIVDHLEDMPVLVKYLKSMGGRHDGYNIQNEHYTIVGTSLIASFKFFFGRDWTSQLEEQWIMAYQMIAETMISGANEKRQSSVAQPTPLSVVPASDTLHQTAKKMARKILAEALEEELDAEFKLLVRKKVQNYLIQALHEEAALIQVDFQKKTG